MMRDYINVDRYLTQLTQDIYGQPPDPLHQEWGEWVINKWFSALVGCKTVIDLGCGEGQFKDAFSRLGIVWTGVSLGQDYLIAKDKGLNVYNCDFTFLPFEENAFDAGLARHSLEHSPMPIVTLLEWRRVIRSWLCVVVPKPEFWTVKGKNHLSVMYKDQLDWVFQLSGWHEIWTYHTDEEYRFMLEKGPIVRE